jgi:hypothetical protein
LSFLCQILKLCLIKFFCCCVAASMFKSFYAKN